jgi:hypothetical protein
MKHHYITFFLFALCRLARIDLQSQMFAYMQVSFDWCGFTCAIFFDHNCLASRGVRVILYIVFIICAYNVCVYKVSRILSMSCSKFGTPGAEDLSDIFDGSSQNASQAYLKFI